MYCERKHVTSEESGRQCSRFPQYRNKSCFFFHLGAMGEFDEKEKPPTLRFQRNMQILVGNGLLLNLRMHFNSIVFSICRILLGFIKARWFSKIFVIHSVINTVKRRGKKIDCIKTAQRTFLKCF